MKLEDVFVWADPHFNHRNVMKFCPKTRPWAVDPLNPTNDEAFVMDKILIEKWNERTKGKTIYIIGDFSFSHDNVYNEWLFSQLHGDKHLIKGNHDGEKIRRLGWSSVSDYKRIGIGMNEFILFHYPMSNWDKIIHGSYHIYGHVHGADVPGKDRLRMLDVSPDNGFAGPVNLQEVVDILKDREIPKPPIW